MRTSDTAGHKSYNPERAKKKNNDSHEIASAADIVIVGAGASGCMAAVSAGLALQKLEKSVTEAADTGEATDTGEAADIDEATDTGKIAKTDEKGVVRGARPVRILLLDGNEKIGKKIYATGNGRCNLTNLRINDDCYHLGDRELLSGHEFVRCVLEEFGPEELIHFMQENGIYLHDRNGYIYPRTDQAATVARAFEKLLSELNIEVKLGDAVISVSGHGEHNTSSGQDDFRNDSKYIIRTFSGKIFSAQKVVLACGGKAGPQYGCGGDGYEFAAAFGHHIREPLPALVQLQSPDSLLGRCAGVRCDARITLLAEDSSEATGCHVLDIQRGELQMTEHGISGIPIFQLSGAAGRALHANRKVKVQIDFLPEFTDEQWNKETEHRLSLSRNCMLGDFFLGLVNRKILTFILARHDLQAEKKAFKVHESDLRAILSEMRNTSIEIDGTGSFRQAQVTSGGIPLSEIDRQFESRCAKGLFLTGELLDVDGICGGYNLQWALTSGWIAGRAAVRKGFCGSARTSEDR